jgi:hypothetical protein
MTQNFDPSPPRIRLDWTSWVLITAIVLLLAVFGLYLYGA